MLGGKNLIPLISAAIISGLDWQWVFKIVAIAAAACVVLIFFFVPETFWDRTPRAKKHVRKHHHLGSLSHLFGTHHNNHSKAQDAVKSPHGETPAGPNANIDLQDVATAGTIAQRRNRTLQHVGFADTAEQATGSPAPAKTNETVSPAPSVPAHATESVQPAQAPSTEHDGTDAAGEKQPATQETIGGEKETAGSEPSKLEEHSLPYFMSRSGVAKVHDEESGHAVAAGAETPLHEVMPATAHTSGTSTPTGSSMHHTYTQHLQVSPPKRYVDTLKPWNGRLRRDNWLRVAVRPFILYAYPAILWSTLVYSLSIGWLIVLSESVSEIYRNSATYNFSALQAGLVYLSPFIGGVLGTAVAGKVSDIVVRFMARRNNGIYEPEFRLVMAGPILLSTTIGLMGFGWSAQERDNFMVPTVMFGIISFGCSLGSTTSITFAVDSYRQYAGEALVTLNFSKSKSPPKHPLLVRANPLRRRPPWLRLLALLHQVAGRGRRPAGVPGGWRHPSRVPAQQHPHVHLRQAGAHVDGA